MERGRGSNDKTAEHHQAMREHEHIESDLLTRHREPVDIGAVLETWRHGSVIRS
jgi:6-phosphogluconate dehydrogenase (decarboxylating)